MLEAASAVADMDEEPGPDDAAPLDPSQPFAGWVVVVTGVFGRGQWGMKNAIAQYGGRVVDAVSGKVTHCVCGADGTTEWGQPTGIGSAKYKQCKKKKVKFVDQAVVDALVDKAPKAQSFAEKLDGEVVGTVVHDLMQFHVDNTQLSSMVEFLGKRSKDIYTVDEEGRTPLHCFAQYARESPNTTAMLRAYCDMLVAADVDPNLPNADKLSALTLCCQQQKFGFAKALLSYPAVDANQYGPPSQQRQYALQRAAQQQQQQQQQLAVQQQQSKRAKTGAAGGSPEPETKKVTPEVNTMSVLHIAIEAGNLEAVKAAVEAGADVNVTTRDDEACPAIVWCAQCAKPELLKFMLTLPAVDVNATNTAGESAICAIARTAAGPELLKFMLTLPAVDVNATDTAGESALLLCTKQGDKDTVAHLLRSERINGNAANAKGEGVVHLLYRRHAQNQQHSYYRHQHGSSNQQEDPWIVSLVHRSWLIPSGGGVSRRESGVYVGVVGWVM